MIGHLLAGRYRLVESIGEGGMGVVYRGEDERLGREVAVKVLHPNVAGAPEVRARFEREAKILARLQHPGAVQVYDYGHEDQSVYLVMELLRGNDLHGMRCSGTEESIAHVVKLIAQVLEVLAVAHQLGIIHRDIKPSNLMLVAGETEAEEQVKVLDFGIAIIRDDSLGARLTRTGIVTGTPIYMSPEQCRGEYLDGRSDLYSLACVLYELLVGSPPFDDAQAVEVVTHHLFTPVRPPRQRLEAISPALDEVIMSSLGKRREDRPSTAEEMRDRLLEALERPDSTRKPTRLERTTGRGAFSSATSDGGATLPGMGVAPALSVTVLEVGSAAADTDAICAALGASGFAPARLSSAEGVDRAAGSGIVIVVPAADEPTGEVVGTLRAGPEPPQVLVCGSESDLDAMTRAIEDGAFDFVPLPLDPPDLIRKIARAIRRPR